jgi:alpha-L-arabinofuranosidase
MVNYYVQQLFSQNQGDDYYFNKITFQQGMGNKDSTLAASCVKDEKTGDIIIKIVNAGSVKASARIDLAAFGKIMPTARLQLLSGDPDMKNTMQAPDAVIPKTSVIETKKKMSYEVPAYSLSVVRIKTRK